ncbi:MAG: galactokinase [Planctomycetota bacterium]
MQRLREPSECHDLPSLVDRVRNRFVKLHERKPRWIVAAPGRVNLIGEHIDYNDGFVLPMAIDRYVAIAADLSRSEDSFHFHSMEMGESTRLSRGSLTPSAAAGWAAYPAGVCALFEQHGFRLPSFDAVIDSTVPRGSGLSSSAALEVATATLLEAMSGARLSPEDKALLCQKAEHTFAGVPCGIMDQFSSVFGRADHLMLIDCQSRSIEQIPFNAPDLAIVVANTNVKHELTGGEYAARRSQCDSAASALGISSWREITAKGLQERTALLSEVERKRAAHVVGEISRTVHASKAIRARDWIGLGQMMFASHASLRDDYEVSCDELNVMVAIAHCIGLEGGVYGSRMTGGGFGGCTVSLVQADRSDAILSQMSKKYELATGIRPHLFATRPAQGAHVAEEATLGVDQDPHHRNGKSACDLDIRH